MKMKMKGVLLFIPMVVTVHVLVGAATTTPKPTTTTYKPKTTTRWPRTTASPGWDLEGKMFTLSRDGGGVSLYPPSYSPSPSPSYYPRRARYTTSRPWTYRGRSRGSFSSKWRSRSSSSSVWRRPTPSYTTSSPQTRTTTPYTTSSYPTWTTASPTRGVTVCARYFAEINHQMFFTLSPQSSSQLRLTDSDGLACTLTFGNYYGRNLYFSSYNSLWSYVNPDFWTRVCVTVDTRKGVAQVVRDGLVSVRKRVTYYVWGDAPVIEFSGFDGQVTDVQVWDFPLRYSDILSYMTNSGYSSYRGNVITWSHVSYSATNRVLLEDKYEWQEERPIRGEGSQTGRMGEKRKRKFSNQHGRKERKREKL